MLSNVFKKVPLLVLIFTLIWSLNAAALAAVTSEIGKTEATTEFKTEIVDELMYTESETSETSAEALNNNQGDKEGSVEAKYPDGEENKVNPTTNSDGTTTKEMKSGESSTISVDDYETTAKTENIDISAENQEEQGVRATEKVKNVQVKVTGDLKINDDKVDTFLSAEKSQGHSVNKEDWTNGFMHVHDYSDHEIENVSILDGLIKFDRGKTRAGVYRKLDDNTNYPYAEAAIFNLQISDQSFGDF